MGAEAERWTAGLLRKLGGWWSIDAVEFYDGDIDHLAVGPAHVLAVETKWTSRKIRVDDQGVHGLWCDALGQAQRSADRIERFLRTKGITQQVIPVLVLWGSGVPRLAGGYQRIGDVRVVAGAQAGEWRDRIGMLADATHDTVGVREAIEGYVNAYDARRRGVRRPFIRRVLGLT